MNLSKIRAAIFFKGIVSSSQLEKWVTDCYKSGFYSRDEFICIMCMLHMEAI